MFERILETLKRNYRQATPAAALDVTVRFVDGFNMSCFLPIESGTNFIRQCNEGEGVLANP